MASGPCALSAFKLKSLTNESSIFQLSSLNSPIYANEIDAADAQVVITVDFKTTIRYWEVLTNIGSEMFPLLSLLELALNYIH